MYTFNTFIHSYLSAVIDIYVYIIYINIHITTIWGLSPYDLGDCMDLSSQITIMIPTAKPAACTT